MFAGIAVAFTAAAGGWKFMRNVTKVEAKEAVEAATASLKWQMDQQEIQIKTQGDQIQHLTRQMGIMQNGHQKAARKLVNALEFLSTAPPKIDEAKGMINGAWDDLSGVKAEA